jgi:CHAP domain
MSKGCVRLRLVISSVAALLVAVLASGTYVARPAFAYTSLCSGALYSACTSNQPSYTDHGYGVNSGTKYWGADPGHNCTNYVAFVETQNGVPRPSFTLGDAGDWWSEAQGHITVSQTPVIGSVAWWSNSSPIGGHVAYVEAVGGNPGSYAITVSEDAWPSGPFDWTQISQGESRWPDGFIYFANLSGGSWGGVGNATSLGTDHLVPAQNMYGGQYITSFNVEDVLVMQTDGNLVAYHGTGWYWQSGTGGHPGAWLAAQSDGNVVIYAQGGGVIWQSHTGGQGLSSIYMQNDGNIVAYNAAGTAAWWSGTGGGPLHTYLGSDHLAANQSLNGDQYIRSLDGRHALQMQADGTLVAFGPGHHICWTTSPPTGGNTGARLDPQSDGNVVIYRSDNWPLWFSGTGGLDLSDLYIQNDGNVVAHRLDGSPLWWSATGGCL